MLSTISDQGKANKNNYTHIRRVRIKKMKNTSADKDVE